MDALELGAGALAWLRQCTILISLRWLLGLAHLLLILFLLAESQLETALLLSCVWLLIRQSSWSLDLCSEPVIEVQFPCASTCDAVRCDQGTQCRLWTRVRGRCHRLDVLRLGVLRSDRFSGGTGGLDGLGLHGLVTSREKRAFRASAALHLTQRGRRLLISQDGRFGSCRLVLSSARGAFLAAVGSGCRLGQFLRVLPLVPEWRLRNLRDWSSFAWRLVGTARVNRLRAERKL